MRRALRREIGADFPEAGAHWPAQRHSERPPPLRSQQIFPYGLTLAFRQFPQPIPHGLAPLSGSEENRRDLIRGYGASGIGYRPSVMHLLQYMYHKRCMPGQDSGSTKKGRERRQLRPPRPCQNDQAYRIEYERRTWATFSPMAAFIRQTSSRAYSFCLSTASRMPRPNSALSSNSELDHAGPRLRGSGP